MLATVCLAGCGGGEASHIPPLWQLPGAAISSAVGNGIYAARRAKVEQYVARHFTAIERDALAGGGPALTEGCDLAGVAPERCSVLGAALRRSPEIYFAGDATEQTVEAVVIAFMVHGD